MSSAASAHAYRIFLLMICLPYLQGGLVKLTNFDGAVREMQHFQLEPASLVAMAVIALELVASLMVLTGRLRWLGALALGVFTFTANLVANRYWKLPDDGRMASMNGFYEHLALSGALLLVAWMDAWGAPAGSEGERS